MKVDVLYIRKTRMDTTISKVFKRFQRGWMVSSAANNSGSANRTRPLFISIRAITNFSDAADKKPSTAAVLLDKGLQPSLARKPALAPIPPFTVCLLWSSLR